MVWQAAISAASAIAQSVLSSNSSSKNVGKRMWQETLYQQYLNDRAQEYNRENMQREYEMNLDLMNRSNAFQELMSNTAHQREMQDLHAAGLNPILAANGGAYSSFGSSASVGLPSVNSGSAGSAGSGEGVPVDMVAFGQLANDNKRVTNETALSKDQSENYRANSALLKAQKDTQEQEQLNIASQIEARKRENDRQDKLAASEIATRKAQINIDRIKANAQYQEASTGSARLAHEKNQYAQSDAAAQADWVRKHPRQAEVTRTIGNWTAPLQQVLPSIGWRIGGYKK